MKYVIWLIEPPIWPTNLWTHALTSSQSDPTLKAMLCIQLEQVIDRIQQVVVFEYQIHWSVKHEQKRKLFFLNKKKLASLFSFRFCRMEVLFLSEKKKRQIDKTKQEFSVL